MINFVKINDTTIAIKYTTIIGCCEKDPTNWKDWIPFDNHSTDEEAQKVLSGEFLLQEKLFDLQNELSENKHVVGDVISQMRLSGKFSEDEIKELIGKELYEQYS